MDILKLNKNLNLDDIYNDLHKYSNSIRKQILELNNLMSLQVSYNPQSFFIMIQKSA